MKDTIIRNTAALLVTFVLGTAVTAMVSKIQTQTSIPAPVYEETVSARGASSKTENTPEPPQSPGIYCIRSHNGYIAVFTDTDENEPDFVSSISVSSLRSNDQALLAQGIKVSSPEEAAALLEDFSG